LIPEKIGNWSIVDKLGAGGQGFVLRGKKRALDGSDVEAAIKVPISDPSGLTEQHKALVIQSLIHEFEMLKLISSPNVCKVVDSGIENVRVGQKTFELPWLATELIKGEDLHTEVTRNGPLDEASWAQLSWDIAIGLEAIHSVNATHLDLKPQNVVRHSRRAIVIDLGGASFVGRYDMGDVIQARTTNFAAPEQLDDKHDPEDYEYPVDLYSLGATMYFAATGRVLFDARAGKATNAPISRRLVMMKSETFDTSGLSEEQVEMITQLCRFEPSARLELNGLKEKLLELLPEKDSRRAASGQASHNPAPSPQTPITNTKTTSASADLGGWIATLLLSFLPPLVGPFIRYFQLRNAKQETSQRYQLRTLLGLGSLMSFGMVGALAFFHKFQKDQSVVSKTLAVIFGVTSVSFFLSTIFGVGSGEGSIIYEFTQVIASIGIVVNVMLIAPLSAAVGIYHPKPREDESTEEKPGVIGEKGVDETGSATNQ